MAKNTKKVNVKVSEKGAKRTSTSLKKVDTSIAGISKSALKSAAALGGMFLGLQAIKGGLDNTIGAAVRQEQIFRKLQTAIEITGKSYKSVKSEIDNTLRSLQDFTAFGDTDSAATLTTLIQLTGNFDEAIGALPLTLDLAATGLFDVNTAAKLMGQVMAGELSLLGRYFAEFKTSNPEFAKLKTNAEKAAFGIKTLNEKVGGTAAKNVATVAGQWERLANELGDVGEAAGDKALPALEELLTFMADSVQDFNKGEGALKSFTDGIVDLADDILKLLDPFDQLKRAFSDDFVGPTDPLKQFNSLIELSIVGFKELTDIRLIALELVPEEVQAWEDKLVAAEAFFSQTQQFTNAAINLSRQLTNKDIQNINKKTKAEIKAVLLSTKSEEEKAAEIANIETQAEQHRSNIRKKQKPFLVAEAIANTAVAVTEVLPNLILAGIIAAAGAVEVATINAQEFGRGGDFVTDGRQNIVVGDNPGGRERVTVTPMSSSNINGPGGGGIQSLTIIQYGGNAQGIEDMVNSSSFLDSVNTAISEGRIVFG